MKKIEEARKYNCASTAINIAKDWLYTQSLYWDNDAKNYPNGSVHQKNSSSMADGFRAILAKI